MSRPRAIPAEKLPVLDAMSAAKLPIKSMARTLGVSETAVRTALARTRTADDFRGVVGSASITAPARKQSPHAWSIERIRAARDAQMRGDFALAVRLAESFRTDDAMFVARNNRIAPQSAIEARIVPHASTRGEAVAKRMRDLVDVPRSVLECCHGTMADHGIAVGYIEHETDREGTRVAMSLREWPLEYVKWNEPAGVLETRTREGVTVPIVHGDGRWIVFRKFLTTPWLQEAAVLPGALVWAAHANGLRDWASSSLAHGLAKIVGELPAGVTLTNTAGALTPQAEAFLRVLQDIATGDASAGIRPAGAKTDFLANGSTAWQVFSELILNREKAAARIYLGTDAILGAVGGAPGVDISALFGVATTKLQGDFTAIEQALKSGLYEPWCAINEGDAKLAPSLAYQLPDPDAKAKAVEKADNRDRLMKQIGDLRAHGMVVDQSTVDALAADLNVSPVPQLAKAPAAAPAQGAPA